MSGIRIDQSTGAQPVILAQDSLVHQGVMFHASRVASVLDTATTVLLIRVAEGQPAHAKIRVLSGGTASVDLYEGPTVSGAGTAVGTLNKNRSSADVAATTLFHTPTISPDGTLISGSLIVATDLTKVVGGQMEWVLAADTDYLLRVTNTSGGTVSIAIEVDFYEPKR